MKDSTAKASVVDEILEFNRDREPKLVRRKFRRMTKDPFAFFRGTDQLFATHWTRLAPPDVAPLGPHLRRPPPGELRRLPDNGRGLPLRHQRLRRSPRGAMQPRPRAVHDQHPARRPDREANLGPGHAKPAGVSRPIPVDGHQVGPVRARRGDGSRHRERANLGPAEEARSWRSSGFSPAPHGASRRRRQAHRTRLGAVSPHRPRPECADS